MKFTIYDQATGLYVADAQGNPDSWDLPDGQEIYRGLFDYKTHKIGMSGDPVLLDGPYRKSDAEILTDIVRERTLRLARGFDYDFQDARGIHHIGTTEQDLAGWGEVTTISSAAIALGQPSAQIQIVTDTGPVVVTALEWQAVLISAAQFRQPIWAASFELQNMAPLPIDVTDNQYWP